MIPSLREELSAMNNSSKEYHPNDTQSDFGHESSIAKLTQRSENESLYAYIIPERTDQQLKVF